MSKKRTRETLDEYLQSEFARTAHFDEQAQRFVYSEQGVRREASGLLGFLRATYYPHYVDGKPYRGHRRKGRASNALQGIRVDTDLEALVRQGHAEGLHPMSAALLAHWQSKGHSIVAAQVPVRIDAYRMTRADVITCETRSGKLYCWEVKTGMAGGLHTKQDYMRSTLRDVPCTRANQWHLQSEYTRHALVTHAALPIAAGRIIQVYEKHKTNELVVKEHRHPAWLKQIKL